MILRAHLPFWRDILNQPYLPTGKWLTIGFQDIHRNARAEEGFNSPDLGQLLENRGIRVTSLDFFDRRADLQLDLNEPIEERHHGEFDMLLDIGSIEHVFDTRQAFINYINLVKVGGYLCLHTPVSGYFSHGLYTFSPETIQKALLGNGCSIVYERFSTSNGQAVTQDQLRDRNALIWLIARKDSLLGDFVNPQQGRWPKQYRRV